ncbi:Hypothetical predicted protein [Marmota monax]|uniref:Uncharacterized protein n=1 Tax=Marmota monax TaxID=9995 RepID=A0A5E4AJA0_MARMO|nr:Hypothetical predicted protein [Marmota monax]
MSACPPPDTWCHRKEQEQVKVPGKNSGAERQIIGKGKLTPLNPQVRRATPHQRS